MYYLITLPFLFIAIIVNLVSERYDLKIFSRVSRIVIIVCIFIFIYTYLDYKNINLLDYVSRFFKI